MNRPDQGLEYWVDGYNVVLRQRRDPEALERAREELLARLKAAGRRAWVVFDSRVGRGQRERRSKRLTVEFAPAGKTADEVILERLARTPDLSRVCIVTDDAELAGRCRFRGAEVSAVGAFLSRLAPPRETPPERRDAPLSRAEVEDWLRYFGQDPDPKEP